MHGIVAMNVHIQLDDREVYVPTFQRAVEYKIRINMPLEYQEKSSTVYSLEREKCFPLTLEKVGQVTDDMYVLGGDFARGGV
jgi:hypothetical protein